MIDLCNITGLCPLAAMLGGAVLGLVVVAALVTSVIHGATGIAGGFLMAAILAQCIDVRAVVPVMSIALLISHSTRVILNAAAFERRVFATIMVWALPGILATAIIYGRLSSVQISFLLGVIVLISVPIRYGIARWRVPATRWAARGAAIVYGLLAGVSVGPGMVLIPFMSAAAPQPATTAATSVATAGTLHRTAIVATLAGIALATNLVRSSIYGATALLDPPYLQLGLLVGILTIPGNGIGRLMLQRMTNQHHTRLVEALTVLGGLNFLRLALV